MVILFYITVIQWLFNAWASAKAALHGQDSVEAGKTVRRQARPCGGRRDCEETDEIMWGQARL